MTEQLSTAHTCSTNTLVTRTFSGPQIETSYSLSITFSSFLHSKESVCNSGDLGSIPRLVRSPRERKSYPFQYSGLENSKDCIVHGVTKSWTWLGDFHLLALMLPVEWSCVRAICLMVWPVPPSSSLLTDKSLLSNHINGLNFSLFSMKKDCLSMAKILKNAGSFLSQFVVTVTGTLSDLCRAD